MDEIPAVAVEVPFDGGETEAIQQDFLYMGMALQDCFGRGEAPFAAPASYSMVLDPTNAEHLQTGGIAARVWYARADKIAFYVDRGMSESMLQHLEIVIAARRMGQGLTFRTLDDDHDAAWMRSFIDSLPSYIRQHLDNVRVG